MKKFLSRRSRGGSGDELGKDGRKHCGALYARQNRRKENYEGMSTWADKYKDGTCVIAKTRCDKEMIRKMEVKRLGIGNGTTDGDEEGDGHIFEQGHVRQSTM